MSSGPPEIVAWISAIGTIVTPILLTLFAAVGWAIQKRVEKAQTIEQELRERSHKLEEALREDRIEVYNQILEPFIILLTKDEGLLNDRAFKGKTKSQIAQEKILSLSYRQAAFKLSLFASDDVVKSYNEIMQFFYSDAAYQSESVETDRRERGFRMLDLFGGLLLEIRKNIGNEGTLLNNTEMIEWLISDIRELQKEYKLNNKQTKSIT